MSDIHDMQNQVREFCEARKWDPYHNAKDLAIGIITESSELLEHFRFVNESEISDRFKNRRIEIEDEVADIFFMLLRFCQKYEINMAQALKNKMEKNSQKYPVSLSRGSNKKYSELS